jgi:hypothetical protein
MCIKRRFAWQSPRAGAAVRYGRSGFSRTNMSVVPETTHVVLGTDPNVISPGNVGEVLATHGYALGPTGTETEAGAGWADKLASAARDWVINALAELLALAMISALA